MMKYRPQLIYENVFCSRECMSRHRSKEHNPEGYRRAEHLTELNRELNPIRMTGSTKWALREKHLGKGEKKAYPKIHGRHAHRVVAEQKLGRKLKPGEVVHHIDGDIQNYSPENLMVFASQAEHLEWHRKHDSRYKGGGAL